MCVHAFVLGCEHVCASVGMSASMCVGVRVCWRVCVCVLVPFYSIRKVSHPVTVAKIVQLVSIRDGEAWLRKNKKRKIVSQIFEMSFGRKKEPSCRAPSQELVSQADRWLLYWLYRL